MGGASGSLVGEFDHRVVSAFSASWLSDWTRMAAAQAITINKERETDTTKDADGKTGEQKSDRRWEEKETQWLILGFPHSKCRFFWGNLPLFSTQHAVWLWHYDSPARSLEQPCFIRNMMKNQQDSGYGPMPHAISSWLVWLVTINHYSSHCIIANPHYRIKWLVDVGCISHYTPISQYSWIIYIYYGQTNYRYNQHEAYLRVHFHSCFSGYVSPYFFEQEKNLPTVRVILNHGEKKPWYDKL